jgi:hypothetical protein
MIWSDLDPFHVWFRNYCGIALDLDFPILQALLLCEPSKQIKNRATTKYMLKRGGALHCLWGPASVINLANGQIISWLKHGVLDREDGPALEYPSKGSYSMSFHGHYNGILTNRGPKLWNIPGWVHRDWSTGRGTKFWLRSGKLHRDNGPAIEYDNGNREWWLNGMLMRVHLDTYMDMYLEATVFYRLGFPVNPDHNIFSMYQFHRTDGPAVIETNGYLEQHSDGYTKSYYIHGTLHRGDGPAVEGPFEGKEWWWNGMKMSEEEVMICAEASKRVLTDLRESSAKRQKIKANDLGLI